MPTLYRPVRGARSALGLQARVQVLYKHVGNARDVLERVQPVDADELPPMPLQLGRRHRARQLYIAQRSAATARYVSGLWCDKSAPSWPLYLYGHRGARNVNGSNRTLKALGFLHQLDYLLRRPIELVDVVGIR